MDILTEAVLELRQRRRRDRHNQKGLDRIAEEVGMERGLSKELLLAANRSMELWEQADGPIHEAREILGTLGESSCYSLIRQMVGNRQEADFGRENRKREGGTHSETTPGKEKADGIEKQPEK